MQASVVLIHTSFSGPQNRQIVSVASQNSGSSTHIFPDVRILLIVCSHASPYHANLTEEGVVHMHMSIWPSESEYTNLDRCSLLAELVINALAECAFSIASSRGMGDSFRITDQSQTSWQLVWL